MDATFWATIALFAFLGLLAYLKVPGMITKSLDDRADKIRTDLNEARKMREEAQALLAEYKRKQGEAESEAEAIITAAKREAEVLGSEAKRKLDDYVERRTKMAEQKIEQAETQALNDVKALAVERAIAASQQVIASKLSDGGASLISASIKDVKAKLM